MFAFARKQCTVYCGLCTQYCVVGRLAQDRVSAVWYCDFSPVCVGSCWALAAVPLLPARDSQGETETPDALLAGIHSLCLTRDSWHCSAHLALCGAAETEGAAWSSGTCCSCCGLSRCWLAQASSWPWLPPHTSSECVHGFAARERGQDEEPWTSQFTEMLNISHSSICGQNRPSRSITW